jgi:glucan 1,3-beta-glucosidase
MDVTTGFGPTLFAEWSQADTDCTKYLNNVGWGNRWEGTYDTGNPLTRVLSATCPTNNGGPTCTCDPANADPTTYTSDYKQFLQMFAEAQMDSFEHGWGWFYWTWQTETAAQWSYKTGLAAGILPAKAYAPEFNCQKTIPTFSNLPENY